MKVKVSNSVCLLLTIFLLAGCDDDTVTGPTRGGVDSLCVDYESYARWLGPLDHLESSRRARSVVASGRYAYVACSQLTPATDIYTIDLENGPEFPAIGHLALDELPRQLVTQGNRLYGLLTDRLTVIDASNPGDLRPLGSFVSEGNLHRMAARPDHVCFVVSSQQLVLLDAADPRSIREVSRLSLPFGARDLVAGPNHVFLSGGEAPFLVVDVSDLEQPRVVGTLDTPHVLDRLYLREQWISAAMIPLDIAVIDVSDPENPRLHGITDTPGRVLSFGTGDRNLMGMARDAYYRSQGGLGQSGGVYLASDGGIMDVAVHGTKALALMGPGSPTSALGVWAADLVSDRIPNRRIPRAWPVEPVPGRFRCGLLENNHMWLANSDGDLQSLYFAHGAVIPIPQGRVALGRHLQAMVRLDDHLYVASGIEGVWTLLVEDPRNPELVAQASTRSSALDIDAADSHVFVADMVAGLEIYAPKGQIGLQRVGGTPLVGDATAVRVLGDFVFVATRGGGLSAIDVSEVTSPSIIAELVLSWSPRSMALLDRLAIVGGDEGLLHVIDVSDPRSMTMVGSVAIPGKVRDVEVHEGMAYVATDGAGVQLVDLSVPQEPRLAGGIQVPDATNGVVLGRGMVYSLGSRWLWMRTLQCWR